MLMRSMGSIWTATFNFIGGSASWGGSSGAGVERRQQMARQAPRRNQHGVETQLEFGMLGMRHQPGLRGVDDSRLLARRHRIGGLIQAGAGLDLDERQQIAPPRDDVDLAIGRAKTLCQDAI